MHHRFRDYFAIIKTGTPCWACPNPLIRKVEIWRLYRSPQTKNFFGLQKWGLKRWVNKRENDFFVFKCDHISNISIPFPAFCEVYFVEIIWNIVRIVAVAESLTMITLSGLRCIIFQKKIQSFKINSRKSWRTESMWGKNWKFRTGNGCWNHPGNGWKWQNLRKESVQEVDGQRR